MALNSMLAKAVSSANVEVVVYTVPADKQFANVSVNLTNVGAAATTVHLGITNNASLTAVDYIETATQLAANGGSLRRTNMILSPNEKLIVKADSGNVGIRVFGLEQI